MLQKHSLQPSLWMPLHLLCGPWTDAVSTATVHGQNDCPQSQLHYIFLFYIFFVTGIQKYKLTLYLATLLDSPVISKNLPLCSFGFSVSSENNEAPHKVQDKNMQVAEPGHIPEL
jgi:hypothetical protein